MFRCLGLMSLRHVVVVCLSIEVFVIRSILTIVQRVIGAVNPLRLLLILHIEALVGDFLAMSFEGLPGARVVCKHSVLVTSDPLLVSISLFIVHLTLVILLLLLGHPVPIHH